MKDMIREKATTAFILASLLAVGVVAGSAWSAPQQAEQGFAWKDGAKCIRRSAHCVMTRASLRSYWAAVTTPSLSNLSCATEAAPCRRFAHQRSMTNHWNNLPSMYRKQRPTSKGGPSHGS